MCLIPGVRTKFNCIISINPKWFSDFSETISFLGVPMVNSLNCYYHQVSNGMASEIEVITNVTYVSLNVPNVLLNSVSQSSPRFTNIDPFRVFFAHEFIDNICAIAVQGRIYCPGLFSFKASMVSGCWAMPANRAALTTGSVAFKSPIRTPLAIDFCPNKLIF